MAKKVYGHLRDAGGKVHVMEVQQPTKRQRESTGTLIPLTPAPRTWLQKLKRDAFG